MDFRHSQSSFFLSLNITKSYKIVESKNSHIKNYKTLKISNGAILKNQEMLKLVPDHYNTKKMSKDVVKKLQFVIINVLD